MIAGAVVLVLAVVALADHGRTEDRVPPLPALCPPSDSSCNAARSVELNGWRVEIERLEDEYARRAWRYGVAGSIVVLASLAFALRRRPSLSVQRRVFADLGVLGVILLVVPTGLFLLVQTPRVDLPALPAFLPALVALGAAAVGGGRARLLGGAPPSARRTEPEALWRRGARYGSVGGLALTGVTVLLAYAYGKGQPSCGGPVESAPGWTDAIGWVVAVTALTAIGLALAGLTGRRWVVALVCLLVNPAALLGMALSSCAFY